MGLRLFGTVLSPPISACVEPRIWQIPSKAPLNSHGKWTWVTTLLSTCPARATDHTGPRGQMGLMLWLTVTPRDGPSPCERPWRAHKSHSLRWGAQDSCCLQGSEHKDQDEFSPVESSPAPVGEAWCQIAGLPGGGVGEGVSPPEGDPCGGGGRGGVHSHTHNTRNTLYLFI